MKILRSKINQVLTIPITGNEEWLNNIYSTFPTPKGKTKPLITGTITLGESGFEEEIRASGHLSYVPFVDCSRCAEAITWAIECDLNARFIHATDPLIEEEDTNYLQGMENDYYFPAEQLDIEPLINDRIQMAIPMQTIKKNQDLSACALCEAPLDQEIVYADQEPEKSQSPFSILGDLLKR